MIKATTHTVLEPTNLCVTVSGGMLRINPDPESGTPWAVTSVSKHTALYGHPVLFCIKLNQTVISRVKLKTRPCRHHHVFCSTQPLTSGFTNNIQQPGPTTRICRYWNIPPSLVHQVHFKLNTIIDFNFPVNFQLLFRYLALCDSS
jgi:hypothetical protein